MQVTHTIETGSPDLTFPVDEWFMSIRPVKLELLDQDQLSVNIAATGFVFSDGDRQWLFTSWHVVTGYDFLDVKVLNPPVRKFIKVISKQIQERGEGWRSIGDTATQTLPLYGTDGIPLWRQQEQYRPHNDLAELGIFIPEHVDLVAIPFEVDIRERNERCYVPEHISTAGLQNGTAVYITGYPWGYSALGDRTPEPLFLVRHIASWVTANPHNFLLDGVGARGMSGSPVFVKGERGFKLVGVYCGAYFPDVAATGHRQDAYSSLGIAVRFSAKSLFRW